MTPTSEAQTSDSRAFTLIELAAVIFIISLFAALVLPSLSALGEKKAKAEAKKMASILRYLHDSARATKSETPLIFDFKESVVVWRVEGRKKKEAFGSLRYVRLPSKGAVAEGELTVLFGPLGAEEDITVGLENEEELYAVTLSGISGRVKIMKTLQSPEAGA